MSAPDSTQQAQAHDEMEKMTMIKNEIPEESQQSLEPVVRPIEAPRVSSSGQGLVWKVWDPSAVAPVSEWFESLDEATDYAKACRLAWIERPGTTEVTLTEAEVSWILSSLSVNRERLEKKAAERKVDGAYAAWIEELGELRQRFATVLGGMRDAR